MSEVIPSSIELHILELFLDWQYDNLISLKIPTMFNEELRGIQNGGLKSHNIINLRKLVQRVLVVSSYPGDVTSNMAYSMFDAFLQK